MAPVTKETERTELAQEVEDVRIEIIGGTLVPPETVELVFNGLKKLLPLEVPKKAAKEEDEETEKVAEVVEPTTWMANDSTDRAAALELFHHAQDPNYPLVTHLARLEPLGLALITPPRTSQLNEKRPSPLHVRAIILAALYLHKGELRLRDPRIPAPSV